MDRRFTARASRRLSALIAASVIAIPAALNSEPPQPKMMALAQAEPSQPFIVARDGGPFVGVHLMDGLMIAGHGASLHVFDASGPRLQLLGKSEPLDGVITDVAIVEDLAYVTTADPYTRGGGAGLAILRFMPPEQPLRLASIPFAAGANALTIDGPIAYVQAAGFMGGAGSVFAAVDVSDPLAPRVLGTMPLSQPGRTRIVHREGFVFTSWGVVIDVREPSAPRSRGTFVRPEGSAIALHGPRLFIAQQGVRVFDITNPVAAVELPPLAPHVDGVSWLALRVSGDALWATSARVVDGDGPHHQYQGMITRFDLSGGSGPMTFETPLLAMDIGVSEDQVAIAGSYGVGVHLDWWEWFHFGPSRDGGFITGSAAIGDLPQDGGMEWRKPFSAVPNGTWSGAIATDDTVLITDVVSVFAVQRTLDTGFSVVGSIVQPDPEPNDSSSGVLIGPSTAYHSERYWTIQPEGLVGYRLSPLLGLTEPITISVQVTDTVREQITASDDFLFHLHIPWGNKPDSLNTYDLRSGQPRLASSIEVDSRSYTASIIGLGSNVYLGNEESLDVFAVDSNGILAPAGSLELDGMPGAMATAGHWLFVLLTGCQEDCASLEVFDTADAAVHHVASVPIPDVGFAVAVTAVNGRVFVLGGDSVLYEVALAPSPHLVGSLRLADGPTCEEWLFCWLDNFSRPWMTPVGSNQLLVNLDYYGTVLIDVPTAAHREVILLPLVGGPDKH